MSIHSGSAAHVLSLLEVGQRHYRETTAERYSVDMSRALVPRSRRPSELDGREFTACVLTAVGNVGDVRYLICVERTA